MTSTASFDFEDIRPYKDDEVDGIISELVNDPEFLTAIAALRAPRLLKISGAITRFLVRRKLKQKLGQYHSVGQLQISVEKYLGHSLGNTANSVTCEGLEKLDPDKNYLFLCNHRDIVLDPAICNMFLHRGGFDTFRIAIGDNLLKRPYSSHLMRLNKSFIVKRGIENRREKLRELIKLSAYIRKSIQEDAQSVWIAHKEGRSKDGLDKTDTALLKMLNLSGGKELDFSQKSLGLHIVPTVISYEWDPCDLMKARELTALEKHGSYDKSEMEDINSIATSIQGQKGDVHVSFGDELDQPFETAEEMADEVDRQIWSSYKLHASNLAAYQRQTGALPSSLEIDSDKLKKADAELQRRLNELQADEQEVLLDAYANSVRSWLSTQ